MKRFSKPKLLAFALAGIVLLSGAGFALATSGGIGQDVDESTADHQNHTALDDGQDGHTANVSNCTYSGSHGDLDLTDEQRAELQETVTQLREDGATPDEIRQAVIDELEAYGVDTDELAAHADHSTKHVQSGSHERMNLTEEQRAEREDMAQQLLEDGASMEEIRQTIQNERMSHGMNATSFPMPGQQLQCEQ